jgi:hypothetical protein
MWGARWGKQTRFAVLDIDPGSKYQNVQALTKLVGELATVRLTATLYQSSSRGGWHAYLFFEEWQDSKQVEETLKTWLRANGYEIRNGTLELYPSGRGLRLPLQAGFAWLNKRCQIQKRREGLTTHEAISQFLNDLETRGSNWAEAKSLMDTQLDTLERLNFANAQAHEKRVSGDGFEGLFEYRLIAEKYDEGREFWLNGLTQKGQRHDAILAIEHYFWHGDQSAGVPALPGTANDEARYRLILGWLQKKHHGFCNHINRGDWHKVETQIRRAVKWRRDYSVVERTPYQLTDCSIDRLIELSRSTGRTWTMDDFKKGNDGRELQARQKISEAVQLLLQENRKVTIRQIIRWTGCSYHTIKRHLDIWCEYAPSVISSVAGDKNSFLALDLKGAPGSRGCTNDLEPIESDLSVDCFITDRPLFRPSPSGSFGSLNKGFLVECFDRVFYVLQGLVCARAPPLFCGVIFIS